MAGKKDGTSGKQADTVAKAAGEQEVTAGTGECCENGACECNCACDCRFPHLAAYHTSWRAMDVTRIVTVLGETADGKAIVFHEHMGVKAMDFADLEKM